MIIDEKTVALWFLTLSETSDWSATLREIGKDSFSFEYRFRYYADDDRDGDPFSFKDKKRFYGGTISASRSEALAKIRALIIELERQCGHRAEEVLMQDGNVSLFMSELATKPWAHMKMMS